MLIGGVYAVAALGFSLVWGIMNVINIVHGAFIMLGAYVTYWLFVSALHLDPFLSIPIAMASTFVLGYALQRFVINSVVRAPLLATFLLTFGLSILITNLALLAFHSDVRAVTTSYSGANFAIAGITIPWAKLWTLAIAIGLTALLNRVLTSTKLGRAIRATSMDVDAARLQGVNVANIYALTMAIGASLAGAAGALVSVSYAIDANMGDPFLIRAFVVSVLGGLGNVNGALVGGVVYGLIESLGAFFFGQGFKEVVALAVLLLVLVFRPNGLLGRAVAS